MSEDSYIPILPYTKMVGQEQLKLALELVYVAPRIGGVLISGERGTGKSTIVRAFAKMMDKELPVTIPINATEDRVVGGWNIDALMRSKPEWQDGLLKEADKKILYIDEVNLLDDHIVNIILDVTSTGVLVVQRDSKKSPPIETHFTLVGTMNPEEGSLRPQLLDRFGLMVRVEAEKDMGKRLEILQTVLAFDEAVALLKNGQPETFFGPASKSVEEYKEKLKNAQKNSQGIEIADDIYKICIHLVKKFQGEGHRGDYLLVLAARACAALDGQKSVTLEHVRKVAPLVLQHRRPEARQLNRVLWGDEENKALEDDALKGLLNHADVRS